jgi:hypothetical protein
VKRRPNEGKSVEAEILHPQQNEQLPRSPPNMRYKPLKVDMDCRIFFLEGDYPKRGILAKDNFLLKPSSYKVLN